MSSRRTPEEEPEQPPRSRRRSPKPARKPGLRERLDLWWPTTVRYVGMAVAIYEILVDKFHNPSALVLAGGMMGLKEVLDSRKGS